MSTNQKVLSKTLVVLAMEVVARQGMERFCRAGLCFDQSPVIVRSDEITPAQWKAIHKEPNLICKEFELGEVDVPESSQSESTDKNIESDDVPSENTLSEDVDQVDELVTAIMQLDPDNEKLWTADGKPQVDALDDIVEFKVTAGLRDDAWTEYQGQAADVELDASEVKGAE